ncbi:hypothetical protein MLD38_017739 [Melastoma candidum]|uniref:Uncharacterized protein n=1 Tax=Melastoma candidum TaxID=119954 RepID=A0ACB9QRP3_9MYRT|nr:hypothetical protein MLD38_017739 [Melastoma candidum]
MVMDRRKLLMNERVEVRQFEEGLQGSWYSGVVVGVSDLCRQIKYDELLSETGRSKLIESIPVSETIDGLYHRRHVPPTYRGRIRPLPASSDSSIRNDKLQFGLCVDAFYEDAWWEGVVFDCEDGARERSVYFPDEHDLQKFSVNDLRVTHVWDEFLDVWSDRGVWVLVELVKELQGDLPSCSYIEKLWNHLLSNYSFNKMISEWTCSVKSLWKKIILEVASEIGGKPRMKNLARRKVVVCNVQTRRRPSLKNSEPDEPANQSLEPSEESKDIREPDAVESTTNKETVLFNDSGKLGQFSKHEDEVRPFSKHEGEVRQFLEHEGEAANFNQSVLFPKVKSQILTRNYLKVRSKNTTQLLFQQSRKAGKAHIGSLFDTWVYVKGLRSRKTRICKKDLSFFHFKSGGKDVSRDTSVLFCRQRKKLTGRNRRRNLVEAKPTYENQPDAVVRMKPPSTQQVDKEGPKADISLSGSGRRLSPAFDRLGQTIRLKDMVSHPRKRKRKRELPQPLQTDSLCSICHNGEGLAFCRRCHSAYHLTCIGSKVMTDGDIPQELWFCPACCCGLCGMRSSSDDDRVFTKICFQCNRLYHVNCLLKEGQLSPPGCSSKRFCSNTCYKLCARLHEFIGTSNCTGVDGLKWTMIRSMQNDSRTCGITRRRNTVKISRALQVIEESFEPIIELHSNRNLIKDVVYNYVSKHRRLNFRGFYLMVLQKDGDIATVATVRIHGQKVAEMPLVATRFQYRRQGLCHILMQELEKLLSHLGIKKLVLPAAAQLQTTWESSFGFSGMPEHDRTELMGYPLLVFQGTTLKQKSIRPLKEIVTAWNKAGKRTRRNMSQINEDGPPIPTRFCSLCLKSRLGKVSEEDMPNHESLAAAYRYVYKRRRILAGRD